MTYRFTVKLLVLFIMFTLISAVGKGKRKKPSAAATSAEEINHIIDTSYEQRTLDQWLKLPLESLRLLCTDNHLSTRGIHASLARRLFDFYSHPPPTIPSPITTNSTLTALDIAEIVKQQISNMFSDPTVLATLASLQSVNKPSSSVADVLSSAGPSTSSATGISYSNSLIQDGAVSQQQPVVSQSQINRGLQALLLPNVTQLIHSNLITDQALLPEDNNVPFQLLHHQQHLSDNPPAILPAVVKKIKNREFINFDLLLPHNSAASPGEYSVQFQPDGPNSDAALSLVPKSSSNSIKVHEISLWLVAWNNFMRTYIHFFPLMAPQLAFYQSMICQYFHRYVFEEVYTFDRNFRARIASSDLFRWDRLDPELAAQYLYTFRPICYKCKQFGHYSTTCPYQRPSGGSAPRYPSSSPNNNITHNLTNQSLMPPFRSPQRINNSRFSTFRSPTAQQTCYYFNSYGDCNRPACTYRHSCESCNGAHSKNHCPNRSRKF